MNQHETKSPLRRIIIVSIVVLFLVTIIGGAISISRLDPPWVANIAEDKLTELLGQDVTIDSIDIDLGTVIFLRAENASVANPPWASEPSLASVDVLEVGIDVFELFSGDLVFTEVNATEPVVHLERSAQGTANWEIKGGIPSSTEDQASVSQGKDGDTLNLPRIESLSVDDGLLTYVDPNYDTLLELSFKSSNQQSPRAQGRIVASGGGQLFGQPLKINLSAGQPPMLEANDTNGYSLKLRLSSAETMLLIEGKVDAPILPETADLQISLEGQNLSGWNEAFEMTLPKLPSYQLVGHVKLLDDKWSINQVKATVTNSDVRGSLRVLPDADPLRVEGNLHSDRLDIAQLQGFMPEQKGSEPVTTPISKLLNFIATASFQTNIKYEADLIETQEAPIKDVEIAMKFENNVLSFDPLFGTIDGTQVNVESHISADEDLAGGRIQFRVETAQSPENAMGTETVRDQKTTALPRFPGNLTIELAVNVTTNRLAINANNFAAADGEKPANRLELNSATIQNLHVNYTDPSSNTKIVAGLNEELSDRDIVIEADGEIHDEPIELSLTIPAPDSLMNPSADEAFQPVAFNLKLAEATASVTASVVPSWPPTKIDLRFLVESERPATIAALFGVEPPTLENLALSGSLSKQDNIWKMTKFISQVGESNMAGVAMIDTADKLRFQAVLKSKNIDVTALMPSKESDEDSLQPSPVDAQQSDSSLSENLTIKPSSPQWLTNLNGKVSVDVDQLVLPGATLEDVSLKASVGEGLLRIAPLSIALGGGTINTRVSLNLQAPGLAGNLRTEIQRVGLDEALTAFAYDASALGTVGGRITLKLPAKTQNMRSNLNVDALLDRLLIEKVRLQYDDPDLQAKTDLRLKTDSFESEMRVEGQVEYQGIPVDVSLSTGSLRQAIENYQALPVDATLHIRETTADINGNVGDLFPLESLTTSLRLAGPDLFRFGESINIPMPHLPPYDLHAKWQKKQLEDGQQISIFENLEGTIGDSDVVGTVRVTTGGERPMVFTRLQSRKLDLDDLAGLTGARPDPEETASAKQKAQAEKFEDRDKLLPDKPMDFTKLQNVDVDMEYRAKRVQAPDLPIDDFLLKMALQDGYMRMNRLDFGVANGTVAMELEVNARMSPIQAKLKTDFDQVHLSKLLASFEMADDSFGNIGGRATLWMKGESLANWFASADGGLYLTMTGGKVDSLLVELAGLDFAESATAFLGTDTGIPIDCAYTDFQARSGIVTIKPFIFDTKDTKFKGHGTIDLRKEQLDLTVNPYPKDFTFLSSRGPLHLTGTFMNPSFSVDPSFPFPEFATADDSARCKGLIENLRKARESDMNKRKINFEPPPDS